MSCDSNESPPKRVSAGSSASGRKVFPNGSVLPPKLELYAVIRAFNFDTDLTSRPIEPPCVPGRYVAPPPKAPIVPLRSTPSGKKALCGRPLKVVEMRANVKPPSACLLKLFELFLKYGRSQIPLTTRR